MGSKYPTPRTVAPAVERTFQDLELRHVAVIVIAARHAHVAEDELREEGEIESDEYDERGQACPTLGIEASGNFGPPEMHPPR